MPYESDNDAYNEYHAVLAEVISVADLFPDHSLVIGGDFNVDFNKHKLQSQLLLMFVPIITCVQARSQDEIFSEAKNAEVPRGWGLGRGWP